MFFFFCFFKSTFTRSKKSFFARKISPIREKKINGMHLQSSIYTEDELNDGLEIQLWTRWNLVWMMPVHLAILFVKRMQSFVYCDAVMETIFSDPSTFVFISCRNSFHIGFRQFVYSLIHAPKMCHTAIQTLCIEVEFRLLVCATFVYSCKRAV